MTSNNEIAKIIFAGKCFMLHSLVTDQVKESIEKVSYIDFEAALDSLFQQSIMAIGEQ